jgi:hypothetical protein
VATESGLLKVLFWLRTKDISQMRLSHIRPVRGAVFDEVNLVSPVDPG